MAIVSVFMTQSRGGLVAAMLVPGVYVIRRYGIGVIVPMALVAVPVHAARAAAAARTPTCLDADALRGLGDRARYVAPQSDLRGRCTPVREPSLPDRAQLVRADARRAWASSGLFLFVAILYLCIKTLVVGVRELSKVPGTAAAQVWGMALLAAMAGIVFQINTLSFAYHSVLWMFFGLVGAWYSAVRHHRPEFKVRLVGTDLLIIAVACVLYASVVLPIFLKLKGEM